MSSSKPLEFSEPIPEAAILEYFIVLTEDMPVYVAISMVDTKTPKLFLENGNNPRYPICKLFFKKSDIKLYLQTIAARKKVGTSNLQIWETTRSKFARFSMAFSRNISKQGMSGFTVKGTVVHKDEFRDVDTFWTSDPQEMV